VLLLLIFPRLIVLQHHEKTGIDSRRGSGTRDMRQQLGVTEKCRPWTGSAERSLCGPHTPERIKHLIDVALVDRIHSNPGQTIDAITRNFFADVSFGVQFKKWGRLESLNTGTLRNLT
jgi:hypothetical protein